MFARLLSRREMAVWCCILSGALLLCVAVQCCLGWGLGAGQALQADTLRLHIRAASDCLADQTAKLAVRDAVLAELDARCPARDKPAALEWAARNLPRLELVARRTLALHGCAPEARVELVNMYFSAAQYPGGRLPAGRYDALRITLGANARSGKNWWCVLYPGLCRSACGGYARPAENDLVCGGYVVRFWLVDRVQALTACRADRTLFSPAA